MDLTTCQRTANIFTHQKGGALEGGGANGQWQGPMTGVKKREHSRRPREPRGVDGQSIWSVSRAAVAGVAGVVGTAGWNDELEAGCGRP